MTESETPNEPLDPKEAMRIALERKKAAEHASGGHGVAADRSQGSAHGPAVGKRQFRRKSGG